MEKSKIALIGVGGNAKSIINALLPHNDVDIFLYEEKNFKEGELFFNIPVKKFSSDVVEKYDRFFITSGDNEKRELTYRNYFSKVNKEFPNIIHPSAIIGENVELGHGNYIGALAYVGPDCKIGNFNILNSSSVTEHDVKINSFNHLAPNSTLCGKIKIENNVFIGAGSTVVQNVSIASHTTIGASSLVISDITSTNKVWAGSPVKLL